jgi:hypothetical protein
VTDESKKFGIIHITIEPPEFLVFGDDFDMVIISPSVSKADRIGEYLNIGETITWRNGVFDFLSKLTSEIVESIFS